MYIQVVKILLLPVLLATCIENKEKTQVKLKQLSAYLQPPPLVKTSSTLATTKLRTVKPRSSLAGKVRSKSTPEDSPNIYRVPRWNFEKETTTDSLTSSKDSKNHGSSRIPETRRKLFPLNSRQRQQTASSSKRQRAILPYSPNQQILTQNPHPHHSKDCNPCNKVPWIPLLEDHAFALDTSAPDSVGHYSHHRDLPISPPQIPSKPLGAGISEEFAQKLIGKPDLGLNFKKPKDVVTYLPPSLLPVSTWSPSSRYVTSHSPSLPEKINPRFVQTERLPRGPPNHNSHLRKHPVPMYRYLLPPPLVPQFPVENKILPSLSSSISASKTETLYGLPFFIPPKPNITTHQHGEIIEPTLSPPYINQAIPFTIHHELPHSLNENTQFKFEQIHYKNLSAHDLGTQFYEPPNYFPAPPLYAAHQFYQNDYNVSLPENLVPPGIPTGNVAFSTQKQENYHQVSHSSHPADNDLKVLDLKGSNIDVIPSIPVSEESYNFSEATNYNENLSHTTVTEPNLRESQPSEDQVISPSQNNQNANTNLHNSHQQYENPSGTHYYYNAPSQTGPNLEVIKSVQVANYISSIEYPLQFVHSPYIDIDTSSPIENIQNGTFQQPTTDLHQYSHSKNISQANLNSDTSDIIVGKPITYENNYYNTYNATNGEYHNNIPNIEDQQTFENSDDLHVYKNDSFFEYSHYNSGQNLTSYPSTYGHEFPGGNEDYSFVGNNTSKGLYHQFQPYTNNSQDANIRLESGKNYEWHNSQNETTEKDKDTLGEDSHSIANQQIALFNPSSTPSPQKVTVYIQPSIQTTALHGESLVHQINNLKHEYHPAPPFPHDQFLSSYPHDSPHNLVKFPQGVPTTQQKGPSPFRNTFGKIENMHPPPFNYIGVIMHPLAHQNVPTPPPFHNSFVNKQPHHLLNGAQNGQVFNPNSQPDQGNYFKWTTIPGSTSAPIPTRHPIVPAWHKPTTAMPLHDSVHGQSIHSIDSAVLLPPPIQHNVRSNIPVKNTKQIQIIVPYTSGKDTVSFQQQRGRPLEIETTGWSPMTGSLNNSTNKTKNCSNSNIKQISECNTGNNLNQWWQQQEDYHQHQESRTVTATASVTSSPFRSTTVNLNSLIREATDKQKPITITQQHILASNIQDLLRGEKENITFSDSIDLKQLQKYIDDWTASEFSSSNISANGSKTNEIQTSVTPEFQSSVISHHLIPSKKIPAEYLTTPPSIFDDFMPLENTIATAVPRLAGKTVPNTLVTKIPSRRTNSSFISLSPTTKRKEYNTSDQKSIFLTNSYLWNTIITTKDTGHTATTSPTTITETTTDATTYDTTTEAEMTSSPSWEDLQVSISPITKEKVYVVTPLSTWPSEPSSTPWPSSNLHTGILSNTPKTTETGAWDGFPFRNSANTIDSFHSPRFSIRPTPGSTMQRSFTVTNEDNDPEESKGTSFYPAENEISYTYSSRETGGGEDSRGSSSSTRRSTADTVLWSLTDLPTYTPPVGARIHTYSGHSRVVTTPTVSTPAPRQRQPVGVLKKYQPERHSYLWHFPELLAPSGEELRNDESAAVHSAIVELQKESKH